MVYSVKNLYSRKRLSALKNYKYSGQDHSYYYRYFLSPIAEGLVRWLPGWLNPNVITLVATMVMSVPLLVVLLYTPNMDKELPSSLHYLFALCLFTHQLLDNCDGKHARRTNQCSPLGQLIDHGCDGLVWFSVGLSTAALGMLSPATQIAIFLFPMYLHYICAWQEYLTDVDRLKKPLDPIFGFNTWDWVAVALCSAALLLLTPIKLVEIKRQTRHHTVYSMMKLFIPIATIFLSTIIWSYSAGGMLAALNCKALIYFVTGATFLCHHIRLCYSNLFKLPFPMLDNCFIPIILGSAMVSALKYWNLPQARIINLIIVILSLAYLLWDLGHLSYHFVNSLCGFLGRNFIFPNKKTAQS